MDPEELGHRPLVPVVEPEARDHLRNGQPGAVLSLSFDPGDEIVTTDHGYGAVDLAVAATRRNV